MTEKGNLLQVSSFDNAVWRRHDGQFWHYRDEFLSYPEKVITIGEESDSYVCVLSASLGVVWIGTWCLGNIEDGCKHVK